jgi:hypothetical protein
MSENKKHWRDTYKSDYLASWDLDGKIVLTISKCQEEECKLSKGKENKVVARFIETTMPNGVKVKPMILNPTNCKFLHSRTGNFSPSDWVGQKIEISVEENSGKVGEKYGLRITKIIPNKAFDIQYILDSVDMAFIRNEANLHRNNMSAEQKEMIREKINALSNVPS